MRAITSVLFLASLAGCAAKVPPASSVPDPEPSQRPERTLADGLERPHLQGRPFAVHSLPLATPSRRASASISARGGISVRSLFEHEPFGNAEFGAHFGFATPSGQIPLQDPFLGCGAAARSDEGRWTGLASSGGRLAVTLVSGGFDAARCEVDVRGVERATVEPLAPEVALYAFRTYNLADLVLIFPRSDRVITDGEAWKGSFTEVRIPLGTGGSMMAEIWRGAVGGFERVLDLPRAAAMERPAASVSVEVVLDDEAMPHGTVYTDLDP